MNKYLGCLLYSGVLLSAQLVNATDLYIGASVGNTDMGGDDVDILEDIGMSVDDKNVGFKIFLGKRINDHFAIEAFYTDLGEMSAKYGTSNANIDVDTIGASIVGIAPINDQFELYAKAGVHIWDASYSSTFLNSEDEDGTSGMLGIGAKYKFKQVNLHAEAEYYPLSDIDVSMISIGLSYDL